MNHFDYKAVPAPRRSKKSKGVREPAELFALTLTDAINEQAREGWEYVRAETLPAETPRGLFRRAAEEDVTMLIFRRARASRDPVLESIEPSSMQQRASEPRLVHAPQPPTQTRTEPSFGGPTVRNFEERVQAASAARREPRISHDGARDTGEEYPSPLRPAPRFDPAEPT